MPLIGAEEATELARAVLERFRVSGHNAAIVAEALVAADLDGLGSHGLARLLAYADQALNGKVDGFAVPEVSCPAPSIIRVDARNGFAFPAIHAGLESAARRLPDTGIVAVAVTRSHHSGVAGRHVEWLARRGLLGMFFSNSPAAMAPWGGRVASFGTNPIAFAAPTAGEPVIVDLSLSKAARGKIMLAAQRGEPIPPDWAFDRHGRPTTDAVEALAGTVAPLGEAKGAALAFMVEILAATLTGATHAFESSSFFDDRGGPPGTGHLILAIDPAPLGDDFIGRMSALTGHMLAQDGVRLPGARRLAVRRQNLESGFPIDEALLGRIRKRLS